MSSPSGPTRIPAGELRDADREPERRRFAPERIARENRAAKGGEGVGDAKPGRPHKVVGT
jgi:hypothetical protein